MERNRTNVASRKREKEEEGDSNDQDRDGNDDKCGRKNAVSLPAAT